jgi:hypothetical protein
LGAIPFHQLLRCFLQSRISGAGAETSEQYCIPLSASPFYTIKFQKSGFSSARTTKCVPSPRCTFVRDNTRLKRSPNSNRRCRDCQRLSPNSSREGLRLFCSEKNDVKLIDISRSTLARDSIVRPKIGAPLDQKEIPDGLKMESQKGLLPVMGICRAA